MEQTIEQGYKDSIDKVTKTIALNLLRKNVDISTIAEVTGLSINTIETFQTEKKIEISLVLKPTINPWFQREWV